MQGVPRKLFDAQVILHLSFRYPERPVVPIHEEQDAHEAWDGVHDTFGVAAVARALMRDVVKVEALLELVDGVVGVALAVGLVDLDAGLVQNFGG